MSDHNNNTFRENQRLSSRLLTKKVTLYDVASLAGVSYQTVSRVINNSPNVALTTRERVLQAISELEFRPNQAARSLNTRQSHVLQIITYNITHLHTVEAMLYTARQLGYRMALSTIWDHTSDNEIREQLDGLSSWLIDGLLIIMPNFSFKYQEQIELCRGIPGVLIGTDLETDAPAVAIDQRYGTNLALQHLLDLGHTQIAEITGDRNFSDGKARHEAYIKFVEAHGLEKDLFVEGNWRGESGYNGVKQLLDKGKHFTALFCGNDEVAIGALLALEECGLRVPTDVSVVGFDDIRISPYVNPPLTTIRQNFPDMGKKAVEYLVEMIKDSNTPIRQHILFPELIVRKSTGPVKEV